MPVTVASRRLIWHTLLKRVVAALAVCERVSPSKTPVADAFARVSDCQSNVTLETFLRPAADNTDRIGRGDVIDYSARSSRFAVAEYVSNALVTFAIVVILYQIKGFQIQQ